MLAAFLAWKYSRYVIAGVLALAAIIALALYLWLRQSALEQAIEERQPVIVEQQQAVNAEKKTAEAANVEAVAAGEKSSKARKNADRSQQEVNRVQNDKRSNVSFEEANRNRCIAYPNSADCVK